MVGGNYTVEFVTVFNGTPVTGHRVLAYVEAYTDGDGDRFPMNTGDPLVISQSEIDAVAAVVSLTPVTDRTTDTQGKVSYHMSLVGCTAGVTSLEFEFRDLSVIVK